MTSGSATSGAGPVIVADLPDAQGRVITLGEVGDDWEAVAAIVPRDEERSFVHPMAAGYLVMSTLGDDWHSFAIRAGQAIVGHAMWAVDEDGSRWIGGVIIAASEQCRGIGRASIQALVGWLHAQAGCTAVRLTVHPENAVAAGLYASLGFTMTGETDGEEIVLEQACQAASGS